MTEKTKLEEMFQTVVSDRGDMFGSSNGGDKLYRVGNLFFSISSTDEIVNNHTERNVVVNYINRTDKTMGTIDSYAAKNIETMCNSKYRDQVIKHLQKYGKYLFLKHSSLRSRNGSCDHTFLSDKYRIVYTRISNGKAFSIPKLTVSSIRGGEIVNFFGANALKIAHVCEKCVHR